MEEMVFSPEDLAPRQLLVRGLPVGNCILREAPKEAVIAYQKKKSLALKLNDEGRAVGTSGSEEAELLLLSMCLYKCVDNGAGDRSKLPVNNHECPDREFLVGEPILKSWHNRIVEPLSEWLQDHSGLSVTPDMLRSRIGFLQKILADLEKAPKNSSSAETSP